MEKLFGYELTRFQKTDIFVFSQQYTLLSGILSPPPTRHGIYFSIPHPYGISYLGKSIHHGEII